jgi:GT2 family glycosyltransferase
VVNSVICSPWTPSDLPLKISSNRHARDHKVVAAIVIYHPDLATLSAVLAAIAAQSRHVLLIANDGKAPTLTLPDNADLLLQNRNIGLGAAYKLAADYARMNGATHLLLLDQDSVADPDMVGALSAAFSGAGDVAASDRCGAMRTPERQGTSFASNDGDQQKSNRPVAPSFRSIS